MKATADDLSGAAPEESVPKPVPAVRSSPGAQERHAAAEREASGPRLYYRTMAHFFSSYAHSDTFGREEGD